MDKPSTTHANTATTGDHLLSKAGRKVGSRAFKDYSKTRDGHVSSADLEGLIRKAYIADNKTAPDSADIAYLIEAHSLNNNPKISSRDFKKVLKDLGEDKWKSNPNYKKNAKPISTTPQVNNPAQLVNPSGMQGGPINKNTSFKVYTLSKDTINRADQVFEQADTDRDGLVSVMTMQYMLHQIFVMDNLADPDPNGVAYLLQKYGFGNSHQLRPTEFKRLLKELAGYKTFDRESIGNYKYTKNPGPYPLDFDHTDVNAYTPGTTPQQVQPNKNVPVPGQNAVRALPLSKNAIRNSKAIFKKHDPQNTGSIPKAALEGAVREVYALDGQQAPVGAELGAILTKYDLVKNDKIGKKQFRRILKEIGGQKTYNRQSFGHVRKLFKK